MSTYIVDEFRKDAELLIEHFLSMIELRFIDRVKLVVSRKRDRFKKKSNSKTLNIRLKKFETVCIESTSKRREKFKKTLVEILKVSKKLSSFRKNMFDTQQIMRTTRRKHILVKRLNVD